MDTVVCGFGGNPDLYGLGIRLGVYFQWVSGLVVYLWYPEGRAEVVVAYFLFVVAVAVATLVLTANAHSTYTAEVFILMYMVFGGAFTCMTNATRRHPRTAENSRQREISGRIWYYTLYSLLLSVVAMYCSWFWLRGIHHDFLMPPCKTYGFFLWKLSLYGRPSIIILAAVSLLLASVAGTFFCVNIWTLVDVFRYHDISTCDTKQATVTAKRRRFDATSTHRQFTDSRAGRKLSYWLRVTNTNQKAFSHIFPPAVNILALVWSFLGVELTLYWNEISGVYSIASTGQLIPFVIGFGGFLRLIGELFWSRLVHENGNRKNDNDRKVSESQTEDIWVCGGICKC